MPYRRRCRGVARAAATAAHAAVAIFVFVSCAAAGGFDLVAGTEAGLYRVSAPRIDASPTVTPLWAGGEVRRIVSTSIGIYLLTDRGVLFGDGSSGFADRSEGLPSATFKTVRDGVASFVTGRKELKDLEADPADPLSLAACTQDSVHVTRDGGRAWLDYGTPSVTPGLKAVALAPWPGSGEPAVWASHPIKGVFARKLAPGSGWAQFSGGLPRIFGSNVEEVADLRSVARPRDGGGTSPELWAGTSFLGRVFRWNPGASRFEQAWGEKFDFGTAESLAAGTAGRDRSVLRFVTRGAVMMLDVNGVGKSGPQAGTASAPPAPAAAAPGPASPAGAAPPTAAPAAPGPASTASGNAPATAPSTAAAVMDVETTGVLQVLAGVLPSRLLCVSGTADGPGGRAAALDLSELWLLGDTPGNERTRNTPGSPREQARRERASRAGGRTGIYLRTDLAIDPARRISYLDMVAARGMDSVVVDLKDDDGRLRFAPRSGLLARLGTVGTVLDVDALVSEARARGIYLIARVVVFKDRALYGRSGGAYAVRDVSGAPWQGYRTVAAAAAPATGAANGAGTGGAATANGTTTTTVQAGNGKAAASPPPANSGAASGGKTAARTQRQPIQEYWVDPYNPQVWEYNVEIAREILERGFDEIQFDYIRFPTDGENLDAATFPARSPGMTRESALESFLAYARERIDAPISIDIYGANGWYRSGSRTGQDVEMMSKYVDVICPMLYPSHFEQEFLADPPAKDRPFRIYRLGTLRTAQIARGGVLVRPYVQAFFLDVSYDRAYYSPVYVADEIRGVRAGAAQGMTFWNNSGRYDDLPANLSR